MLLDLLDYSETATIELVIHTMHEDPERKVEGAPNTFVRADDYQGFKPIILLNG